MGFELELVKLYVIDFEIDVKHKLSMQFDVLFSEFFMNKIHFEVNYSEKNSILTLRVVTNDFDYMNSFYEAFLGEKSVWNYRIDKWEGRRL